MSQKLNILIIDDEKNIRFLLERFLTKKGYTVDTACDGAVGYVKLLNNKYDCILLDLQMPNMNGMEFLEAMEITRPNQRVIIISAYLQETKIHRFIKKNEVFPYIAKPFELDQVESKILELCT